MIVTVEGLIGAGKTTLLESLKNIHIPGYTIIVAPEPLDDWHVTTGTEEYDLLQLFFQHPKKYAFIFQLHALRSRIEQVRGLEEHDENTIVFLERSVYSDGIFASVQSALGNIDDVQFAEYKWQFKQAVKDTPRIDSIIYLDVDVDTCMQRIKKRNREGEIVSKSYLELLKAQHDSFTNKKHSKGQLCDVLHVKDNTDPERILNSLLKL